MLASILNGITNYGRAFGLISKLKLWGYLVVPGLLSLFLGGIVFGTAWFLSDDIGGWMTSWYPFEWGATVINKIGTALGGIFIIAIALILYKYIILILVGPFMSPLSQKIEEHLTQQKFESQSLGANMKSIWRGVRMSISMILGELFWVVLLSLLGFIPLLTLFTTILIFAVQSYYAGMGVMDFTAERHFNVKESIRFARSNKGLAIGSGLVYLGLLFIPIIGLLLAPPLSTIASTIGTVEKLQQKVIA